MRNRTKNIVVWALLMVFVGADGVLALPPNPDNAALVYYQAFLMYKPPGQELGKKLSDVAEGKAKLDEEVKIYVSGCSSAIQLAVLASDLPKCDWGLFYSEGFGMLMPHLAQVRQLNRVVVVKARIEIEQGNYDEATKLCLASRKMAQHVGGSTLISHLVACALNRSTYACIRELMPYLARQPEKLEKFKAQLSELALKDMFSIAPALELEIEVVRKHMNVDKIGELMNFVNEGAPDMAPEVKPELLKESFDRYKKHMEKAIALLGQDEPYVILYPKLVELDAAAKEVSAKDEQAVLMKATAPAVASIYGVNTAVRASATATMAGLDIYLLKAKSGKFPDELPAGLPKDPFTGKDFKYERTKTGFILRCGAKDVRKDIVYEFEFGVSE